MIGRKRKRLGDLLVDAGVVTSEQLGEALKKQRELGLKLGETLIELKFTDENEIVEALHQQMGYPVAKIREAKIAPEVISLLPETIVREARLHREPAESQSTRCVMLTVLMTRFVSYFHLAMEKMCTM